MPVSPGGQPGAVVRAYFVWGDVFKETVLTFGGVLSNRACLAASMPLLIGYQLPVCFPEVNQSFDIATYLLDGMLSFRLFRVFF